MNIRFSFVLDKNVPHEPEYSAYENGFIEGALNIYVDGKLFFNGKFVNLAELNGVFTSIRRKFFNIC